MASTIIPPPRTRRWTRVEYERLIELGVFEPGERLELVDGLLVVREPQGSRHAAAIRRVLTALRRLSATPGRSTRSCRLPSMRSRSRSPTSPWCHAIRARTVTRIPHAPS